MRLLVLAGGFGTRLRSTVTDVPKALAPVNGTPFLKLQIENWIAQGVDEFTFLLHHEANQIIDLLHLMKNNLLSDYKVNWVTEDKPMDTGGAIANAVKELCLTGDFLVTNADTWLGTGFQEIMKSPSPSIVVVSISDASRYGSINFNSSNQVTDFTEKNSLITPGWINAGLYHLSASYFKNWNDRPFSLERDLFIELMLNDRLTAVPVQTSFIDIGVPNDYYQFCRLFSESHNGLLCN